MFGDNHYLRSFYVKFKFMHFQGTFCQEMYMARHARKLDTLFHITVCDINISVNQVMP